MSVRARDSISLLSTVTVYSMLAAQRLIVDDLQANAITANNIHAELIEADIIQATQIEGQYIISDSIMTNYLTADQIQTDYLTATQIASAYASISQLYAKGIDVSDLNATVITTDILNSAVSNLGYVTAATVEAGYADIDLANVELISGEAFITEDLVTGNAYINAAYIKNLTADSLRLRGKDGLYYAINVDQGEVSADETDQDVIDEYGSFISGEAMLDRTITASKIYVDDLYAIKGQFGTAKIGGLILESGSIHTDGVTSVNDADKGFYLNSAGEMALLGHNSALKFFIDASDNNRRKLSITADEIFIGSTNVATVSSHAESAYSNGIKSTVQLWYTKSNTTAPSKPSSVVTSTSTSGNAWRVVVPTYNSSYPYYYYCFQYQYNDGTYGWSDVVRDLATEESQLQARTAAGDLANYITSNDAALTNLQSQLDGQIEAWYIDGAPNEGGSASTAYMGTKSTTPSSASASISFSGLSGEPTSFIVYTTSNLTTGSSPYKVAAVVFDGTTLHGQTITNRSNAQVTYDASSFTKTYSNGTLTITSTGAYFQAQQYRLEYSYGGTSSNIHTASVQPGSNATSITFSDLVGQPMFLSLIFKSNFGTVSGSQRVIWIADKYDGEGGFGMSMDSAARYSSSNYPTYAPSTTTVTLTTSSASAGGYFYSSGYYQLTYVLQQAASNINDPALQWTTLDLKKRHLGDLYYDINTGHSWRYLATDQEDASTYSWSPIPDSDAAAALATAQAAQTLANSKRRIFVSQPTVPYNIGDVWIDTVNGSKVIKYATVDRTTGSYTASDWSLAATAITDIVREYATNQSATTAPTTGWSTTVPTWQDGWYIWERVTTYTNGASSVGTPVCITGATGATGENGNGIASISVYYAATQLQVAPSAADITSTTIPTMGGNNKYLWKKEVVTYTDQAVPNTTTITLIAIYGDTGPAGATGNGYIYITSTHSANSSSWTGSTTQLSSITTGTQILFNLRVAPGGSNVTLNLTLSNNSTTGAKNVYFNGSTRLTNEYPISSMIPLVYNGSSWYVASPYTNTYIYDRVQHGSTVICDPASTGKGIYVYEGSGYKKLTAGDTFDINYPPLYMSVDTTGITSTGAMYDVMPNVNLTYNKSNVSLTQGKMAYIVGTVTGNIFTVDTAVFSTAPTINDGKIYIPVGILASTTTIYFQSSKELYKFDIYKGFGLIQNAAILDQKTEYSLSKNEDGVKLISNISYAFMRLAVTGEPDATSDQWDSTLDENNWYLVPEVTPSYPYLWRKEITTYSDNTTYTSVSKVFTYDSGTTQKPARYAYRYVWTATDNTPEMNDISYVTIHALTEPYTHLWQKEVIEYTDTESFPRNRYARQIYVDWSYNIPENVRDGYLWSREKIFYAIGDPLYTSPVCVSEFNKNIIERDLENLKDYAYTQTVGLITNEHTVMMQSLSSYVTKSTYESRIDTIEHAIEVNEQGISLKAEASVVDSLDATVNGEGGLVAFKQTIGKYMTFNLDGLTISASNTAVKTVIDNDSWTLQKGTTVLQKVDANDGAQFSTLTLKQLTGNSGLARLVLGALTLEIQSDNTVIGRKTG